MTARPLVTISIPTFNSEHTLEICLKAIQGQTYQNIEVNIVDGYSKDRTINIAKDLGVKTIKKSKKALLGARYEGTIIANGKYTVLLDSDQVLESDTIERAVKKIEQDDLDMLVLEEDVYKANNWLEKLFKQDRKLIHQVQDYSPYTGVMLPRFFRTTILKKAFSNIPEGMLESTGGPDHAIIYFEAWQLTEKIDLLEQAVKHVEPNSLKVMMKKFYRWGYTSNSAHNSRYKELMKRKERFRTGMFSKGTYKASMASIVLLLIKGIPYAAGRIIAEFRNN